MSARVYGLAGLTGAQLLLISGGNVSYMIERKEKKDNRKNGQRKEDRELVHVCVRVCVYKCERAV